MAPTDRRRAVGGKGTGRPCARAEPAPLLALPFFIGETSDQCVRRKQRGGEGRGVFSRARTAERSAGSDRGRPCRALCVASHDGAGVPVLAGSPIRWSVRPTPTFLPSSRTSSRWGRGGCGLCVQRLRIAVREAGICKSGLCPSSARLSAKSNSVGKACPQKTFRGLLVSSKDIYYISE